MTRRDVLYRVLVMAVLACAVIAVYGQVSNHSFVEYDDAGYVKENPFVRRGLSWDGVRWAFTTNAMGNWHPLTWLSLMLDVQLFGVNPGALLLVSVAFHLLNTLVLFVVWERMTGATWLSFLVAALFAVHPLHVESVAWIAERKDVLSTLFWLLTLWAYVRFTETGARSSYVLALVLFALGLMAKPMLVTLPFTLLLLDLWPLQRIGFSGPESRVLGPGLKNGRHRTSSIENSGPGTRDPGPQSRSQYLLSIVNEKVPFLLLTVAASVIAVITQRQVGAMAQLEAIPLGLRVTNAVVAYVRYLVSMVWPVGLAVLYPLDAHMPLWQPIVATGVLTAVSLFVIRISRQYPYALVGWLWYLGTLVPVIGLVQVGSQALADRYTYVPFIGIFTALAWGGHDICQRLALPRRVAVGGVAVMIAVYAALAGRQVALWKDSRTLLVHALQVTHDNCIVHNNLGVALAAEGETEAAMAHYREALRIKPDYADAYNNVALAYWRQGRREEAAANYAASLRYAPDAVETHTNIGLLLNEEKKFDEAIVHLTEALRLDPNCIAARINLGNALRDTGRRDEALAQYHEALRIRPDAADAYNNIGAILAEQGQHEEAAALFRTALRHDPHSVNNLNNLGLVLLQMGQPAEAIPQFTEALRVSPDAADIHLNLANALRDSGRPAEAAEQYAQVVRLKPESAEAHYQLGLNLLSTNQLDAALDHLRQAVTLNPTHAQAHNDLGVALVSAGKLAEAIDHFQTALQLSPDLPDAQQNLAIAEAMQQPEKKD